MAFSKHLLAVLGALCVSAPLIADEGVTEQQKVYDALSPEMRETIRKIKEGQVNTIEKQARSDGGVDTEVQVLIIKDHPVAVAAVNEDGEIIVTEF